MFKTEDQRTQACGILLQQLIRGSADLWTEQGPTPLAMEILENNGSPLSRGERVLLLAAFAIWTGDTKLAFTEIFELDSNKLLAVGSLISAVAQGGSAIEEWMAIWDVRSATRHFDA